MTTIEKKTVIKALTYYRESMMQQEATAQRNGEQKQAIESGREASIAGGLVSEFCRILNEPCGSCKI